MGKSLAKQTGKRRTIPLCFSILLLCCYFFISCNSSNQQPKAPSSNKTETEAGNKKESFPRPKLIDIPKTKLPKVVKCGKPVIIADSSARGIPFFTNYGADQGLGLNEITAIVTDSLGNLWFGTAAGGVSRYDGRNFTTFTTAHGLGANGIGSMTVDRSGNIWFGTFGGGLCMFDGKSFTNHWKFHASFIYSVIEDKAHFIWIATNYGIYRYDGKTFINYTAANGLAGVNAQCIIEDKDGYLWIATDGGISRFDGRNFVNYKTDNGLVNNSVNVIMQDKSGTFWIGTHRGVSRFDGKHFSNFTTKDGLADNYVTSITQDSYGNFWFGTPNKGVSKFDGKRFSTYATAEGLASNYVECIARDNSGDLWFGTGGGVSRYSSNGFTDFTKSLNLKDNFINSILKDKSGNIWFCTDASGVIKYDGTKFTQYTTLQGLKSNNVQSIFQDKSGNLWFGFFGSVSKFDGKNFVDYDYFLPEPDAVRCIGQDDNGNMWFGTTGTGALMFDGTRFSNLTITEGLVANNVFSFIPGIKDGSFWIGTYRGVSRLAGRTITNFNTPQGLASDYVLSMVQDLTDDEIWIGTNGGGISRFDGKQFNNLSSAEGLADDVVSAMASDSGRNLIWIGSNLGLSNFKPGLHSDENNIQNFNKKTGYPINDINNGALCVDDKGIVWAGCGDNKLIRFDYSAVGRNAIPLRLVIQGIKVNTQPICWNNLPHKIEADLNKDSMNLLTEVVTIFGRSLSAAALDSMREKYADVRFDSISRFYPVPVNMELPYKDNNVSIDFAAIEPDLPKLVKYQYKLEGYSKDWSPQSNGTTAVFGNIPEGKYTFKLKALSPSGVLSSIEYNFSILPPWHRTWWAYTIYAICFVAISFFANRSIRRKIIEKEKAKAREKELAQAKEIEKAYTELKATQAQLIQSEKMASLGELTAGIAHEIQNPLNFVNNFSEVNTELIDELEIEVTKGNLSEVRSIAKDIKENEQKINHHGKRADAIVRGMLQHSRSSTGQREPVDINALADEYLRLAYHGLRAKDSAFNAILKTDFDASIRSINIVPQDIGRVLLNLYNNSFYAVREKSKQRVQGYEPTVSVYTKKTDHTITIGIKDNGMGIPQKVIDKIFQPFFTTKPTGQGTGLGLSLSYDIIKGHGGNITVETEEGEMSEFIIQLPAS
jgi:ligand-binding sensor domain-containing protein/signal transduction histidine kinase